MNKVWWNTDALTVPVRDRRRDIGKRARRETKPYLPNGIYTWQNGE